MLANLSDPSAIGAGMAVALLTTMYGAILANVVFIPLSGKLEGQVSQLDIENSLRFNNGLTLLTLTATQFQAVIEHGVAATGPGSTPGQFAQVGMKFGDIWKIARRLSHAKLVEIIRAKLGGLMHGPRLPVSIVIHQ